MPGADAAAGGARNYATVLPLAGALILVISLLGSLMYWQQARGERAAARGGAVDIGFAQFMSLHHEQAIEMARIMHEGGTGSLDTLSEAIIDKQLHELDAMHGWLRDWQQELQPRTRKMTWMLAGGEPPGAALRQYLLDCERSPTGMPGLATVAELDQLRALQGTAQEQRFLELMLAHHRGGIPMAAFAAENARVAAVRELAAGIVADQTAELDEMQSLLGAIRPESPS